MLLDWNDIAIRQRIVGVGHAEFADPINRHLNAVLRGGAEKFYTFGDFWDMTRYEPGFRVDQTKWLDSHKNRHEGSFVLMRSKIVAMGVTVVNLALGGKVETYAERPPFDRMCTKFKFPLNLPMPK